MPRPILGPASPCPLTNRTRVLVGCPDCDGVIATRQSAARLGDRCASCAVRHMHRERAARREVYGVGVRGETSARGRAGRAA